MTLIMTVVLPSVRLCLATVSVPLLIPVRLMSNMEMVILLQM